MRGTEKLAEGIIAWERLACVDTHVCAFACVCVCVFVCVCMRAFVRTCVHACMHACMMHVCMLPTYAGMKFS